MLEQINSPQDLKKLNEKEKKQLAEEIRKYILDVVSENGGQSSLKFRSGRTNNSTTLRI